MKRIIVIWLEIAVPLFVLASVAAIMGSAFEVFVFSVSLYTFVRLVCHLNKPKPDKKQDNTFTWELDDTESH